MRRSLLNKRILPKPLRQALVLFTLLLLPSAAWGQTTYKSGIYDSDNKTWGDWNVTWDSEEAITNVKNVIGSNDVLSFTIVGNKTGTITLSLTLPENIEDDRICYAIFSPQTSSNTSITTSQTIKKIHNDTHTTLEFKSVGSSYIYSPDTPADCSGGDKIEISFEITNSSGTGVELGILTAEVTTGIAYPISVTGVTVTNYNKDDVLEQSINGNSTVSFTPAEGTTPATLTLNKATLIVSTNEGAAIESSLDNLVVNLVNENTVQAQAGSQTVSTFYAFKGNGSNTITFETDVNAQKPGTIGGLVLEQYVSTDVSLAYQEGLGLSRNGDSFTIGIIIYGITVGDTKVTYFNAEDILEDNGSVSFNNETSTLTLTNAYLDLSAFEEYHTIKWNSTNQLNVVIVGDNTVLSLESCFEGKDASNKADIKFSKGEGDCSLRLTMENGSGSVLTNLIDITSYGTGLFKTLFNGESDIFISSQELLLRIADSKGVYHPITGTINNIFDDDEGTVSFENNILTLKNATIGNSDTNSPIISNIKELTVHLIGSQNKINTNNYAFIYGGNEDSPTLTFSTVDPSDYENLGMLDIEGISSIGDIASGYAVKGLVGETSTAIANWKEDTSSTPDRSVSGWKYLVNTGSEPFVKLSYREVYDLWISYSRYCSDNLTLTGETFNPTTSTLTFNGISGSTYQIYSGLDDLTIKIGSKTQLKAITFGAPNDETIGATSGKLTIMKNETSTAAVNKLTLANDDTDGGVISGFSSVTIKEPMGVKTPSPFTTWGGTIHEAVISDEIFYDLWVMGQRVTSANASDIFGAAQSSQPIVATFDAEESTLTLNGLQLSNSITYPTCIESGLEDLTVSLSGENKFQKGGDVTTLYGFKAQDGKTCNITFEASGSFSFMVQTEPEYAVSGFNKVTYKDNLIAYKKDGKTYISTLRLQFGADNTDNPTAITISPVQEGVELFSHKIAYEINYAKDGIDNIAQTEYTAAIPISTISAGPCIVSAYTIDGDNTKSNATKSYYFIYSESELIIGTGSTLDLRDYLLPSIAEEDNWLCDHTTGNTDIISIESQNGIITGLADGTATVTTQIIDGNEEYSVLNYYISQLSIDVTVQDIIGESTFASGQSYGTFYNTTEAYNLPEGLKAYIITNVDEEKGTIEMTETSVLPPNTPVLMYRTSTTVSPNYVFTKASNVEPATTKLKYTTTDKPAEESSKLYVLYNGQFVKVTAGTKILANHCYLDLGGTSAGTRGFYNIGDGEGTTAIREVIYEGMNSEKLADGAWHDLQGRKFTTKPTKPGLYILNGKKIVIK